MDPGRVSLLFVIQQPRKEAPIALPCDILKGALWCVQEISQLFSCRESPFHLWQTDKSNPHSSHSHLPLGEFYPHSTKSATSLAECILAGLLGARAAVRHLEICSDMSFCLTEGTGILLLLPLGNLWVMEQLPCLCVYILATLQALFSLPKFAEKLDWFQTSKLIAKAS